MKHKTEITDPWQISEKEFPAGGTVAQKWEFFLTYATLAPSSHNTQPWQFHVQGNHVDIYADRRRACPVVDPIDRELIMSCGCALFNLRSAMLHFAALGGVEIFPSAAERDLLARVWRGNHGDTSTDGKKIFNAITRRRTNRQIFRDEPLPEELIAELKAAANEESAWLGIADDPDRKHELAVLIAEGERRQWADQDFREELAEWITCVRTPRENGIPGHSFGVDDLMSSAEPSLVRTFDLGNGQAAKDEDLASGSPVLAVLMTTKDNPVAWLSAGQALERILLLARAENIWASFLNQAVEVADLRPKLMVLMGHSGSPQIVLRLGYGDEVTPTPRRPIEELLVS
jgi:nitroreductase